MNKKPKKESITMTEIVAEPAKPKPTLAEIENGLRGRVSSYRQHAAKANELRGAIEVDAGMSIDKVLARFGGADKVYAENQPWTSKGSSPLKTAIVKAMEMLPESKGPTGAKLKSIVETIAAHDLYPGRKLDQSSASTCLKRGTLEGTFERVASGYYRLLKGQ